MTTAYTSLLGFALPVTGELDGTWGDTVNNSITQLAEDAIAGVATQSVTSGDWTLTTTGSGATNEARKAILIPTGSPGVSRNILAPNKSKGYIVVNQSDAQVVLKGSTGPTTGVTIAPGIKALCAWNGSDFVEVSGGLVSLTTGVTGTLPVANGGTGVTSSTGSGSVVLSNSPTLVTPTLGTPSSGTLTNATGLPLSTGVTGTLPVGNGGTGAATFTANNVLLGNGTSAFQVVAPGANGNVLTSNGTTWTSAAPSGGGGALSAITAATTSATIANGNNPIAWNWTQTTASQTGFAIGETTASTGGAGSQVLFKVGTLASSTADPLQVQHQGVDVYRVTYIGNVILNAGTSSTISPSITVQGGTSTAAAGQGGWAQIYGGTPGVTGVGGTVKLLSGAGGATSGASGQITLATGTTTNGATGNISLTVGNPSGSNVAGILTLQGGQSLTTQSGNSGGIVLNGGAAGAVASVAGGPIVLTAGAGSTTTTGGVGGAVTITAGAGGLTANGGALNLTAGASGTGLNAVGGNVNITSGGGVDPGNVVITGGTGTGAGSGKGEVQITGGGLGAAVLIKGGPSLSSAIPTGNLSLTIQDHSNNGRAGILTIQGGISTTTQSGNSGGVVINGGATGAVASVAGGPIVLTAGAGSTTTTGGVGGAVTITAGAGGLAATGGAATLKAGNGGATGAGGAVAITAGNGNSALGGDITLTTGTGSTNGAVNFVNTNVANGSVATTLTSLGPTGSSTTVVGWLKIKVGGTTQYIPYW